MVSGSISRSANTIQRTPAGNFAGQTLAAEEWVVGPLADVPFTGWTLTPDETISVSGSNVMMAEKTQ